MKSYTLPILLFLVVAFAAAHTMGDEARKVRRTDYTDTVRWHRVDPGAEVPDEKYPDEKLAPRSRRPSSAGSGIDAPLPLPPVMPEKPRERSRDRDLPTGLINLDEKQQDQQPFGWGWLADGLQAINERTESTGEADLDALDEPAGERMPAPSDGLWPQEPAGLSTPTFEDLFQTSDAVDPLIPAWLSTGLEAPPQGVAPSEQQETAISASERYGLPTLEMPGLFEMDTEFRGNAGAGREALPQTAAIMAEFTRPVLETLRPANLPFGDLQPASASDRAPGSFLMGVDSPLQEERSFMRIESASERTPLPGLELGASFRQRNEEPFARQSPFFDQERSLLTELAPERTPTSIIDQPTDMGGRLPNPTLERNAFDR